MVQEMLWVYRKDGKSIYLPAGLQRVVHAGVRLHLALFAENRVRVAGSHLENLVAFYYLCAQLWAIPSASTLEVEFSHLAIFWQSCDNSSTVLSVPEAEAEAEVGIWDSCKHVSTGVTVIRSSKLKAKRQLQSAVFDPSLEYVWNLLSVYWCTLMVGWIRRCPPWCCCACLYNQSSHDMLVYKTVLSVLSRYTWMFAGSFGFTPHKNRVM